jgi:4-amino-4-deoxy-L-arabinose transferase-like glycosyltransferase
MRSRSLLVPRYLSLTIQRSAPLAILAVATLLRFFALPQRGLIYWDEGKFALEGIRMEAGLLALFGAHVSLIVGKTIGTAKPTHALLIGLAYIVFGIHDYAPLLLNAAASVVQVALVYRVARRLFGPGVALISALFLAVSEYDVIYARSALSESDANALLLAGVLAWVSGCVHPLGRSFSKNERTAGSWRISASSRVPLVAGLLIGVAFTTNYRLIIYVGALVAFDLIWTVMDPVFRTPDIRVGIVGSPITTLKYTSRLAPLGGRMLAWITGLAIAPLAWQLIDVIARARGLVLFRNELTGRREWYLYQVLYQLHEGKQAVLHFSPVPYLQWWLVREGWPLSLLLLIGIGLALRYRSFPWLAMAVPVVVPYLVYIFAPFIVPRNLDAAVPFACVLAAAALVTIATSMRLVRIQASLITVVTLAIGALGATMSWRLTAERSGFARAAAYVEQHDHGRALISNEVMVFYLRGSGSHCDAPPLPDRVSRLAADVAAGYHYAVLDHSRSPLTLFVRHHMPRVVRYLATGPISIGENPISSENSYPPDPHAPIEYVTVFRLDKHLLPPPRPDDHPEECDRNRTA